mmetsp:Transcript_58753/g.140008  ORF Transcript_58753/g.140008 Transcript_58753/m.140008 type:complete len:493 (+) Transcript_58753:63-1541(+)
MTLRQHVPTVPSCWQHAFTAHTAVDPHGTNMRILRPPVEAAQPIKHGIAPSSRRVETLCVGAAVIALASGVRLRRDRRRRIGRAQLSILRAKGRSPKESGSQWSAGPAADAETAGSDAGASRSASEKDHWATKPSPIFSAAAEGPSFEEDAPIGEEAVSARKAKTNWTWNDPGMSPRESARLAAESGWQQDTWSPSDNTYFDTYPHQFARRLKEASPRISVKAHVEREQLGNRTRKRLPKGEKYPVDFSGYDPMHNGERYSLDDGRKTRLEAMATSVHKGFLRRRASCPPGGLRGKLGVYPDAERSEVAFIGMSNVGKSSLLNAVTRTMKLAPAADEPGVTRSIDWYKPSKLPIDIVDLPGYGSAKGADFGHLVAEFVRTRKALRCVYVLIESRRGIRPPDWEWLSMMGSQGPEKVFVITKCDLTPPKILARAATLMLRDLEGMPNISSRMILVSAKKGNGMHDLRTDMCKRAIGWAKEAAAHSQGSELVAE